ncbi:Putative restriction endonuclease [Neomoorella glycerini]|uniref:Restriction endonuclease n=1 Tax=Neomoorella glycerini TaxID=55779 RepID=A0A6I5ZS31_9FIRM|nr:Uma2 family endonuclease [Moorella glycerini]QGP92833.1 Putative restriction endonuclease [Moorella glycerini]
MAAVEVARRRFTVEEFYQMARAGILGENDRVELIDGEIIEMVPIGTRHAACVRRMDRIFSTKIGNNALVDTQNPLRLDQNSEPQPDLMLLKPRDDYYASFHPRPEDVLLLVEVADTSVAYDREVKVNLYAKGGVNEVWLVNLQAQQVTAYRLPSPSGYREIKEYGRGDHISLLAFPGLNIPVQDIIPGD